VIQTGLLTGFRRQELISLRPEDIDSARKTVSVAAHNSKNGEGRTLPCGPRLMATLQEALACRGPAGTVFVSEKGLPWTTNTFGKAFTQACRRAGLEPLSPHVLRHTFASRLVMAGVDLRTVQELMGHKSILMTMRYAHLSPDHTRAAMETLESRFAGKSPATFPDTPGAARPEDGGKLTAAR
jgi:integrase